MKTRVAEALARYGMLDGCRNVTVGLSGGADSCALLGVLCELREETEMNVSACHINHSLRGAESDRDEAFAVSLCERFGVPVEVYRVDVRGSVVKHESIEEAARRAEDRGPARHRDLALHGAEDAVTGRRQATGASSGAAAGPAALRARAGTSRQDGPAGRGGEARAAAGRRQGASAA